MNVYLQNIKEFLGRLTTGQKVALALVLVGGIGILTGVAYWAGKPDYALLFGNLEPQAANKVVEALQTDGTQYELRDNGTAIYVPREQVYELRLRFAGEGVISDGVLGYELFDKGTLGMTDFMQKLNMRRALEGELARTISNIKQVDACRVHLVMPERSPFRETQTQPSASVILQLAGNTRLSPEQIDGITQLVAGAVEGLSPADVTVLDARGNMLSDPDADDADVLISSNQLKHQRAIELMLTEKGQSILDQIVGRGNAVVRVNATLNFNRSIEERQLIDPESATVIAEERQDQQGGEDVANSSIRNYELSRTTERTERSVGDVQYLTVSVLLNAKRAEPAEGAAEGAEEAEALPEPQFVTYPAEELAEIEQLVKNAVGFSTQRGDQFAIHQTRFDTSVDDQLADEIRQQRRNEEMQLYLRYGLMVLALGVAVWLMRSASKRLGARPGELEGTLQAEAVDGAPGQLGAGQGPAQLGAHPDDDDEDFVLIDDVYTSKLSPEARARLKAKHIMFEEIKRQVLEKPDATADLIRSWLIEDMSAN